METSTGVHNRNEGESANNILHALPGCKSRHHFRGIPIALTYFSSGNKKENSIYHFMMSEVKV